MLAVLPWRSVKASETDLQEMVMARTVRWVELAAVVTLMTTAPALSATARPDPGDPSAEQSCTAVARGHALSYEPNCPLRRIGDQLVRCDNLTGAGAAAPSWVPEY
jgi:hypothetical protein